MKIIKLRIAGQKAGRLIDMSDWIATPISDANGKYPDFNVYGFHTGRKVVVRYSDGNEDVVAYQGFGMFGNDDRQDVTHWKAC